MIINRELELADKVMIVIMGLSVLPKVKNKDICVLNHLKCKKQFMILENLKTYNQQKVEWVKSEYMTNLSILDFSLVTAHI